MTIQYSKKRVVERLLTVSGLTVSERRAIYWWGIHIIGYRRPYKGSSNWWDRMMLKQSVTLRNEEIDRFITAILTPAAPEQTRRAFSRLRRKIPESVLKDFDATGVHRLYELENSCRRIFRMGQIMPEKEQEVWADGVDE